MYTVHIYRYARIFFLFYPSKLSSLAVQLRKDTIALACLSPAARIIQRSDSAGRVPRGAVGAPGRSESWKEAKQARQNTSLGDFGHHRATQGQAGHPFVPAQSLLCPLFLPARGCRGSPARDPRSQGGGGRLGREGTGSTRCPAALCAGRSPFVRPAWPSQRVP